MAFPLHALTSAHLLVRSLFPGSWPFSPVLSVGLPACHDLPSVWNISYLSSPVWSCFCVRPQIRLTPGKASCLNQVPFSVLQGHHIHLSLSGLHVCPRVHTPHWALSSFKAKTMSLDYYYSFSTQCLA